MPKKRSGKKSPDIPLIGEVDDWEKDAIEALLDVPQGGECTLYFDSAGGSVYGALTVAALIRQRKLQCTGIVLGECSSATILILAACKHRRVTRYSTLLFHRMRWQSDKRVAAEEAAVWARHFEDMERELDRWQFQLFGQAEEQIRAWTKGNQYVTGTQMVEAGLAELLEV